MMTKRIIGICLMLILTVSFAMAETVDNNAVADKYVVDGEKAVLIDTPDLSVYLTGTNEASDNCNGISGNFMIHLDCVIENKSNNPISFVRYNGVINGWSLGSNYTMSNTKGIQPGTKVKTDIWFTTEDTEVTNFDSLESMNLTFLVQYENNEEIEEVTGNVHFHATAEDLQQINTEEVTAETDNGVQGAEEDAQQTSEEAVVEVEYETLEKGSKGEAVKQLQQYLIALGFLKGNADGDFGNKTAEAVTEFQQSNDIEATGIADTETQKKLVELGEVMVIKTEGKKALEQLKTSYDKVQKITWYMHKNQPKYADTCCYIYPYIGRYDSGYAWLRVSADYTDAQTDDGWVFYDRIIFSIDGKNTVKTFNRNQITRDNDSEVWEIADFEPDADDIELLKNIAASSETIMRFQGNDKYADHVVTNKEKTAIVDVLIAYEYLTKYYNE